MNSCFYEIKQIIQIIVIATNLISFIVITLLTNEKEINYIEYTSLPKILSNIYIFIILTILLIDLIFPKLMCNFLKENLSILRSDVGKIIINLAVSIPYWSSNNSAHVIFGIITFVSSFALFLCEFIFECNILKNKKFDNENIDNNNIIHIENNKELYLVK